MEERSYRSFDFDRLADQPTGPAPPPEWRQWHETPVAAQVLAEGEDPDQWEYEEHAHHGRGVALPVALFFATCVTTFLAGVFDSKSFLPVLIKAPSLFWETIANNWWTGALYMLSVMGILFTHEMGHFLQAMRYRVAASLPYFIPMPNLFGTMGAVIGMQGTQANRKELFDIGLTGPLAGLVIALPVTIIGVMQANVIPVVHGSGTHFNPPYLLDVLMRWYHPEMGPGMTLRYGPLLMAGWVGLFVTGLNMLPISQLDGGHVAYALFGRGAWTLARLVLFAVMAFIVLAQAYQWMIMLLLIMFLGADHPPTRNDQQPIGWGRYVLGLASLALPLLCVAPFPISG